MLDVFTHNAQLTMPGGHVMKRPCHYTMHGSNDLHLELTEEPKDCISDPDDSRQLIDDTFNLDRDSQSKSWSKKLAYAAKFKVSI